MFAIGLFIFSGLLGAESLPLKPIMTLETIPDEAPELLRWPADVTIDANGNIYVLDMGANTVFSWDSAGKYRGNFGEQGEGPGEFNFFARTGGPQGYISSIDDDLVIYAGGNKVIHIFGTDMKFKRKIPYQVINGRVESLRALSPDRFLVFCSSYFSDEPYRQIGIFNAAGEMIKELAKAPDTTWSRGSEGGNNKIVLKPYETSLFMHHDSKLDRIMVGDTAKPAFALNKSTGEADRKVGTKIPRVAITDEDIKDFNEMSWIKNSKWFTTEFPDQHAYYNKLMPLGDKGFLMVNQTAGQSRVQGYLIDPQGKVLGRVKMELGSAGGLFGARQRVIGVSSDSDEEITIQEFDIQGSQVMTATK